MKRLAFAIVLATIAVATPRAAASRRLSFISNSFTFGELSLSPSPATQEQVKTPLAVSIRVTSEVSLHEPVVLEYSIVNESLKAIEVGLGFDRVGWLEFEHTAPDGKRTLTHPLPRFSGGGRPDDFSIEGSGRYEQAAALDEWLDFSGLGVHTVSVRFRTTAPPVASFRFPTPSTFSVRVVPRDAARLRSKAEALWVRATQCCTDDSWAAVNQLSYLRDVEAIPYFERLMEQKLTTRFFQTLIEIGGPAARASLERLSLSPTDFVARLAKDALARIK
jgi:hypothetical protein